MADQEQPEFRLLGRVGARADQRPGTQGTAVARAALLAGHVLIQLTDAGQRILPPHQEVPGNDQVVKLQESGEIEPRPQRRGAGHVAPRGDLLGIEHLLVTHDVPASHSPPARPSGQMDDRPAFQRGRQREAPEDRGGEMAHDGAGGSNQGAHLRQQAAPVGGRGPYTVAWPDEVPSPCPAPAQPSGAGLGNGKGLV